MTEQEKRMILERYRKLDREIDWNLERLAQWRSFANRVTAGYGVGAGGKTAHTDRIQTSFDKIETLTERINADIDKLVDLRTAIEHHLSAIPDATARILLWERYIGGKTNEEIATALNYCTKQVIRIHAKALGELSLPDEMREYLT